MKQTLAGLALVTCGCMTAGGGGLEHVPPDEVRTGVPIGIRVRAFVVDGWGHPVCRYDDVRCRYRLVGEFEYESIEMVTRDGPAALLACVIPPLPHDARGEFEYVIDCDLDETPNRVHFGPIPIVSAEAR